jgi:serine protease
VLGLSLSSKRFWVLLAAILIAFAAMGGAQANMGLSAQTIDKLVEPERIIAGLHESPNQRVRVIVELAVPSDALSTAQEGGPDLSERQTNIERAQQRVLASALAIDGGMAAAEASDNFAIRLLRYSPMFAISADAALLGRLASDPSVLRIHEDRTSRPLLSDTVDLIGGPEAQAQGATGDGWAVAVLDTGARRTHKFLSGKVVAAACFSTHQPAQQITSTCPASATSSTAINSADDCHDANRRGCGHGTHVSGVAAGSNATPLAGQPVGGVAPGANIISINVYTQRWAPDCVDLPAQYTSGCLESFLADQIAGLEHVLDLSADHNIAAVVMSFGDGDKNGSDCNSDPRAPIISDLRSQGISVFAAAGNEGFPDSINAPACIGNVAAIAASDKQDSIAPFSNWGAPVDLVAPGFQVTSSDTIGTDVDLNHWSSKSGTSIAAAHVAGAVAALKSVVPGASTAAIFNALYDGGRDVTHAGITRPIIDMGEALKLLGGPAAKAEMLTPAPGSQLPGNSVSFSWSQGNHVTEYGLSVGTTGPGSWDIFSQMLLTDTSRTVSSLPPSGTIYVRLFSRIGGVLQYNDYTYTGGENRAVMISPTPGTVLPGTQVEFSWTEGIDAVEYRLWVFDRPGHGNNSYFTETTTEQTVMATNLPNSGLLRVRLTTVFENGSNRLIEYDYTAGGLKAQITSPQVSEFFPLVPPDVEFQWSAGTGVLEYRLDVGTSGPGSTDVFSSSTGTSQSQLVEGIPYFGPIHVRLHSRFEAYWEYADYEYQTNGAISQVTGPIPGSTLTATNVTFNWSLGTGVTEYRLLVGTQGPGSNDLFDENTGTERNRAVDVPNNGTIYVRVYSRIDGQWYFDDATYAGGGGKAAMVSPTPPTELRGSSINFIWSLGDGVDEYRLEIGDQGAGSSNIFSQSWTSQDRFHVYGLPDSGTLHVRLSSRFGDVWQHNDYAYTMNVSQAAELLSPGDGTMVSVPQIYEWTSAAGATSYSLWFGSGPGRADYWSFTYTAAQGTVHSISKPPGTWYDGRPLYVRLSTTVPSGIFWRDYVLQTPDIETDPRAEMITPTPGTKIVGSQAVFTWAEGQTHPDSGPVNEYDIRVGTGSPGQADIFAGSTGLGTSQLVTGLPTDGTLINVRLRTRFGNNDWQFRDYVYTALVGQAAQLVSPAPGTTIGGTTANFAWTQGAGVSEYWLRIGSSPGSSNLFNSSMGTATSATVPGLPASGDIHVQLSSRLGDTWVDEDYVYQGAAADLAEMIAPTPGGTLGTTETFMWTQGVGPVEYRLMLGTQGAGSADVFDQTLGASTSRQVTGIPEGTTIHARLFSRFADGAWGHRDYVYGPSKADIVAPVEGSTLGGSSATFEWSAGSGAQAYRLAVGSTVGGTEYHDSGVLSTDTLSRQVAGLPTDGSIVHVRLSTQLGGVWQFNDYSYTAATSVGTKAVMASPAPSSTLPGSTVTFQWDAGTQAQAYWLYVGNTVGGFQYHDSGQLSTATLSRQVIGLPTDGSTVRVRLYTRLAGQWQFNDYSYTAASGSVKATITSPTPNSTLAGSTATFQWNAGTGAQSYWLYVGNTVGGFQYHDSGQLSTATLSRQVTGLPTDGSTVRVRLYTRLAGVWEFNDYVYTAATSSGTKATITSPTPNSTLAGSTATFQWNAGTGAQSYWLYVGNTVGGFQYHDSGQLSTATLSRQVTALPTDGSTVRVRLYTRLAGVWEFNDYSYTAATSSGTKAAITSPAPGSTLAGSTVTFQWNAGSQAQSYWLYVGNTVGGFQYHDSGQLSSATLSRQVTGLPTDGSTVRVRLYTRLAGVWEFNDYSYTAAAGGGTKAAMVAPVSGSTLPGTAVTFRWSTGVGVTQYWLEVGTTGVGSRNLVDASTGTNTWRNVAGLPTAGTIYVRLWSLIGGAWQFNDYSYTGGGANIAAMTAPTPGSTLGSTSVTFAWSAGTGVSQYWLEIGTTPGGTNLFNASTGTNTSQTVTGLPTTGTLFVRLWSLQGGVWRVNDYVYVGMSGVSSASYEGPAEGGSRM